MLFAVIHLADEPREGEEVFVIVPGGAKTAIGVPLDALAQFLPLLAQAAGDLPPPRCAVCSARLPAAIAESEVGP
jgi:hypothetical protein